MSETYTEDTNEEPDQDDDLFDEVVHQDDNASECVVQNGGDDNLKNDSSKDGDE